QPSFPELLDIVHEAEGAGDGQLVAKHTRIDIEGQALLPDERRIEVDLDVEMKPGMRRQLAPGRAFLDTNRLEHFDVLARLRQLTDAGLIDRFHERRRAAVHDRHFLAVDLDVAVVDRQSTERCEQMLDRPDSDARVVAYDGAEREIL